MRLVAKAGIAAALIFTMVGADSCQTNDKTGPSEVVHHHPNALQAGDFAHCRKVTGAYLFRARGLPFTASYRDGIDGACRAAPANTSDAVVAQEAMDIARGKSP